MQGCDGCTLCCKLFEVKDLESSQNEYCRMCEPGVGCSIHSSRPDCCRIFQCCYSQMDKAGVELKPSKCGVVFEKIADNLILASLDIPIDSASSIVRSQVEHFRREGISVMLQQFDPFKTHCIMADGATREEILGLLKEKYDDSAKLH